MRKILTFAAAFALFASTQAFAIAGFGVHYVMNTGSLGSNIDIAKQSSLGDIKVRQEGADMLKGIGFKGWLDIIPVVDVEFTFNVAATRYKSFLIIPTPGDDKEISLEYAPDAPYNMVFDKASPMFGIVNGDLSVTWPPFDIPFVRPYIGAGVSYFASIPLVDASFASKMLSDDLITLLDDPDAAADVGSALSKALKDADYKTGLGGHLIAGVRLQAFIFAIYANGKYYFGGNINDRFTQGLVLELGGGLAL